MPRALCLAVLLALSAAVSLTADWKITTRTTDGRGSDSVETAYYKGKLSRHEAVIDGVPQGTSVLDREAEQATFWDLKRKEFVSLPLNPHSKAVPTAMEETSARPVLLIETNTTDTGEQKTMLGRTARHWITVQKRSNQETPGAEAKPESEEVIDAWYVEASGLPFEVRSSFGAVLILSSSADKRSPVIKQTHTGSLPTGLAVRTKTTWRSFEYPATSENERDVTELQEGTLAPAVFLPPADFKHVDQLTETSLRYQRSFSDEIELYWNSFENWLYNLLY